MDRMPPPSRRPPASNKPSHLLKQVLTSKYDGSVATTPLLEEPETLNSEPLSVGEDDLSALPSWQQYWTTNKLVEVTGRGAFNVYAAGESGPIVFCLHGAGYTGLTWSMVAQHMKDGYRIVAPDLRHHGLSCSTQDKDFSREVLVEDIVELLRTYVNETQFEDFESKPVPVVLVGHSMGGGLAVWAAAALEAAAEKLPLRVEGTVVIDVVEGTAIAALPHMLAVLNSRPPSFPSISAALQWAHRTGVSKDKQAALISLPSQLKNAEEGSNGWVWRTKLHDTQPHWEGWYTGLSEQFLALHCPKVLILAGTDRLDRTLTIGQMQGKFQLVLLPLAGHAVHEDQHQQTSQHLRDFLKRFRIGQPIVAVPRAAGVRPVLPVVAGPVFRS